jgi:hypothetical protein
MELKEQLVLVLKEHKEQLDHRELQALRHQAVLLLLMS